MTMPPSARGSGPVPSPAERVHSVLATATSVTLASGHVGMQLVTRASFRSGVVVVRPGAVDPLTPVVRCAPPASVAGMLHLTDPAPVAVRDRVRARIVLRGWLEVVDDDGSDALGLHVRHVVLDQGGELAAFDAARLHLTGPDPLAGVEAQWLQRLATAHAPALAPLAARMPSGPREHHVRPLALDRYGLVLRVEGPDDHRDVRLPFPSPVRTPQQASAALRALLSLT